MQPPPGITALLTLLLGAEAEQPMPPAPSLCVAPVQVLPATALTPEEILRPLGRCVRVFREQCGVTVALRRPVSITLPELAARSGIMEPGVDPKAPPTQTARHRRQGRHVIALKLSARPAVEAITHAPRNGDPRCVPLYFVGNTGAPRAFSLPPGYSNGPPVGYVQPLKPGAFISDDADPMQLCHELGHMTGLAHSELTRGEDDDGPDNMMHANAWPAHGEQLSGAQCAAMRYYLRR